MTPSPAMEEASFKPGRENWVSDGNVSACTKCRADFSLMNRKHHCRACGNIFCGKCTNQKLAYTAYTRVQEAGYKQKVKRVCADCFRSISSTRANIAMMSALAEACTVPNFSVIMQGPAPGLVALHYHMNKPRLETLDEAGE